MIYKQSYVIMLGGGLTETENKRMCVIYGLISGRGLLRNLSGGSLRESSSLVKIFGGSSKIFKDPPRSAKICKGLLKILEDKDLLKILTDPRGFLEDPIKIS